MVENLLEGSITIKELAYNLKVTTNKRECVSEDNQTNRKKGWIDYSENIYLLL